MCKTELITKINHLKKDSNKLLTDVRTIKNKMMLQKKQMEINLKKQEDFILNFSNLS
jgi:hypothetical protein